MEDRIKYNEVKVYRNCKELKELGGRPSCDVNTDPVPCDPWKSASDKKWHGADHWNGEDIRTTAELTRWKDFRKHQKRVRKNSEIFSKYEENVQKFQDETNISWAVGLQKEWERQSKMDEWKEYYIYEYRKRRIREKELRQAIQEFKLGQEELRAAGGATVTANLWSRAKESAEYRQKLLEAKKEEEQAQKTLEAVKVDAPREAIERDALIKRAQKGLESAKRKLMETRSDEMDILNKEFDRAGIEQGLRRRRQCVMNAESRLIRLDTLLRWIDGEFPKIAEEMEHTLQEQARPPTPDPLSKTAIKPSLSKFKKNTRNKEQRSIVQSGIRSVDVSKVFKTPRQKRRLFNQGRSTAIQETQWPAEIPAPSGNALRRNQRIPKRLQSPALSVSIQHPPTRRRSLRILELTEKLRAQAYHRDVETARLRTTAQRKSTLRTTTHRDAAYFGRPQGIPKKKNSRLSPMKEETRHWRTFSRR